MGSGGKIRVKKEKRKPKCPGSCNVHKINQRVEIPRESNEK